MEKENLDNLFRESLDEFRQEPDPRVWDRIRASLDKKDGRRRRVVPLWWQLGGTAAALALLLFLLIPGGKEGTLPQTDPDTESPAVSNETEIPNPIEDLPTPSSDDALVIDQPAPSSASEPGVDQAIQNKSSLPSEAAAVVQNNAVQQTTVDMADEQGQTDRTPSPQAQGVAVQAGQQDPAGVLAEDLRGAEVAGNTKQSERIDSSEESLTDPAEAEEMKAREELLADTKEDPVIESKDKQGRWAIGPSIAPVFFNGIGDGSPIDQAFISNDKSGSFNMSYGMQVSYQVNKRLQLRSGMHRVDFGYNTNDIVFSSALQTSASTQMKNVDYSSSSEYLVVTSQNAAPTKSNSAIRSEIAARNTSRSGTMVQEFGYLEVPLELNYAIIDRTFGVHLISGISSLFLVDNTVSLESNLGTTEVGQANNLNDVNFSANIGFGMQYRVSDKFNVQIEPLIKYQLNTFSDTAGEFRPYSIGIYSGIRYKF